ncbi:FAD-dependent monooxygenase [Elizabethkingia meningoseptica]|uniref:FAD-dependent monooxygenase n=1 Tax=Elizabethkingia meningoseptica TaxID=238 RepID=UPI0023B0B7DE|nr:FAD-dependent monooxygenase [Elizabethkingia meningoseptica]MDE5437582.1 FAD-dependent monooxygenase [Elizabethkingia meningoseptica]MDE5468012.1 FAD-dependent monooxygenase [Elizabethkingia meningoseptica]MDE5474931.1 FAD-dependent monooxygenase [Elizabethkingia meningoseptica]MDE5478364.1 FAD-dependent monooxygenase [Elizabethkingia meningoseptica]MDE5486763.1 FAD-dependent monooxygenase [Elizabethkingia meningoseptica]
MKKHILISGAGIAGLTAANFLAKQGHSVTVIDRSSSFSKAGFLISLKSFGVKIMDELGLTQNLQAESSPSETVHFVETNERVIQSIDYDKMHTNIERSVLISRGGLHHVLYEAVKNDVNVLFETTISQLEEKSDMTKVTLSNGNSIGVDLVIVSEGLRSSTRERYFTNYQLEDFNTLYVGGKLKLNHEKQVGVFKVYVDVNKSLHIYPIAEDEIAIQCYIRSSKDIGFIKNNASSILKDSFADYNPEVKQLLQSLLDDGLFFMDKMGMINASNLRNGRMVLLGDAGFCPTALSGMGASLSIYGAKALAHYIAEYPDDILTACDNYNTLMQPVVEKFQTNAKNNAASFLPKSEADLEKFVDGFRTADDKAVQKIMTDPIVLTKNQEDFILN